MGKVPFRASNSRCRRRRVAGLTIGSSSRSALRPSVFAKEPSVRRSTSVKTIRRPPRRVRNARFSAFRYAIRAAACRANQAAMLPDSRTTKYSTRSDIALCYRGVYRNGNLSFRTVRVRLPIGVFEHNDSPALDGNAYKLDTLELLAVFVSPAASCPASTRCISLAQPSSTSDCKVSMSASLKCR